MSVMKRPAGDLGGGGAGSVTKKAASDEDADVRFMRLAITLGERGRRTTAPNPWVGAILVAADGLTVLGEGFHKGPGQPHAEVEAFRDAEARGHSDFSGATLYSTLEPCHRNEGKRTPPCDELVIAKKVRRCVIGHIDPDRRFGGAGEDFLRKAGIEVVTAVAEDEVRASLRCYLHQRSTGLPYVVLKIATSLDGRTGCADGTSQWITKAAAREDAHRLRADSQAILVGSGTALQDKPSLTVRLPEDAGLREQPLRVVLDTRGRVVEGPLMDTSKAPTLIFTSAELCSAEAKAKWDACGVQHCDVALVKAEDSVDPGGAGLDLCAVLRELAGRGVLQLMVEGGAAVQGQLLTLGLCEELRVYLGATLLGASAQPWARTALTSTIADAKFWRLRDLRRLADDVCIEYERLPPAA